jgi:hypothetical protein
MSTKQTNEKRAESDLKLAVYCSLAHKRPHTLEEIGSIMGVTRERVRQIEQEAMKKLRFRFKKIWKDDNLSDSDLLKVLDSVDKNYNIYEY